VAGQSGAAPIRDGHVCSGAILGRGWSSRYRGGAWQSGAGCGAVFRPATSKHWRFCSVLLRLLCSSREKEGREREREGGREGERERGFCVAEQF